MTDLFPAAAVIVLDEEGAPSNAANDPGGETVFGIARNRHPDIPWPPTHDQALALYRSRYWERCGCDGLAWRWALPLFDCAVNQGEEEAPLLLQRTLGVKVDGHIGPVTQGAANHASDELLDLFFALRGIRYSQHPRFADFGKGWLKRTYYIRVVAETSP